jgi:GntR family transcriptional regulator
MARTAHFLPTAAHRCRSQSELERMDPRLPPYIRLGDAIRSQINAGDWVCGGPLPAESTLAQIYAVSVGTVRQTIQQLVDEGLVERRHGSGTYVRRSRLENSLLNCFSPPANSNGRDDLSRVISREVRAIEDTPAARLNLSPGEQTIVLETIHTKSGHPILSEAIVVPVEPFRPLLDADIDRLSGALYPDYETLCGQIVGSAEEHMTVGYADETAAAKLGIAEGAPVVIVERLARNRAGTPVEWRMCRARPEGFIVQIQVR